MSSPISKILKLLEEGKITAEEAQDLIEAMGGKHEAGPPPSPGEPAQKAVIEEPVAAAVGEGQAEEEDAQAQTTSSVSAPFGNIAEAIERVGREVSTSVNWAEIGEQVRSGAQKGVEFLKKAAEQVKEGNFSIFIGEHEKREIILPLNLQEGAMLRVENLAGNIHVRCDAPESRVIARATFRGESKEAAREQADKYSLVVEENENLVWIKQGDVAHVAVQLEIELARSAAVELRTELGDIKVNGTSGTTKLQCSSGDITCEQISGTLDANSSSGDIIVRHGQLTLANLETKSGLIEMHDISGALTIRTSSGDITLRNASCSTVSAEAVTGDVEADFSTPFEGTMNIRTVSGNIDTRIPDGCNARVSLSAIRGDTIATVDLRDPVRSQGRISGVLGEGTGTIDLSAVSGDIVLRVRDHGTI